MIDRHKAMLRATLIGCGQWPINHSLITDMFKDQANTVKELDKSVYAGIEMHA